MVCTTNKPWRQRAQIFNQVNEMLGRPHRTEPAMQMQWRRSNIREQSQTVSRPRRTRNGSDFGLQAFSVRHKGNAARCSTDGVHSNPRRAPNIPIRTCFNRQVGACLTLEMAAHWPRCTLLSTAASMLISLRTALDGRGLLQPPSYLSRNTLANGNLTNTIPIIFDLIRLPTASARVSGYSGSLGVRGIGKLCSLSSLCILATVCFR